MSADQLHRGNKDVAKHKTIHDVMTEKVELAQIYARDGAFYSASRVLRTLATELEAHAKACNEATRSD